MAFDAGNIFQTYLQGANFVAGSLERAEDRRRQQEQDELRSVAGKGLEIFAPKYDKDGKLLPRTSGDIFNDPATLELANHPYMKAARMQGITDPRVKDVRYVGGSPLEDGKHVVPIVEQLDEDGTVISRGPLTEGRSRDGNAAVTPITVDTMFNHLAGEVYRRDPEIGAALINQSRKQALGGLQTQYRNAQSDAEREQLVQIWSSYGGTPDDLTKNSGTPVTKQRLDGTVQEIQPGGSTTVRFDPEVAKVGDQVANRETERLVSRKGSLADADLSIAEGQAARKTQLEVTEAKARALADLEFKETFGPRIRELAAQQQRSTAEVEEELRAKYFPEMVKRKVTEIGATVQATAGANYEAAPTVKKTNEVLNPVPAQDEKGLLQAREILNPSAVPTLLSKGEAVADQTVLDWAPKLTTNDLQGLYAGLARAYQNGNPAAAKPLESVRRILHDAAADKTEGGKAETFKPAKFSYDLMSNAIKGSGLGEDALTVARPQMMQKVGRLAQDFGIPDDNEVLKSQAHLAALDAYQLEHDQDDAMFKGRAYSNAEGPMFLRRYIESTGIKSVGESPREFMDKIYTPIVNETGLNITDPKQRNDLLKLTALASSVMDNGVDPDDAVATVINLTKDPAKAARATEAMKGDSESARISSMGQALASEIKTRRQNSMKSTLREGADFTFGGGMWR